MVTLDSIPRIELQSNDFLAQIAKRLPNDKVRGVFIRVTSSPLFWAVAQVSTLIVFATILTSSTLSLPANVFVPLIGYGLIGIGCYVYHNRKELLYEITLIYTIATNALYHNRAWYSQITEHLVLGAIPLKDHGHLWAISKESHVSAVLSMLESFENQKQGLFTTPVLPNEWRAINVNHRQISAEDFKPVELDHIVEGVRFIHEHIEKHETVYVHCKAGKGRSATVVICYLLKHKEFNTVDDAIAYVKQKRPEINLNLRQRAAVDAYFEKYCQKN